ncbi:HD domain-containing phosphohydrolase [Deinococcus deserti]|uniref:Putative diguanylate cyclase(GGDEF)/Metal dependent phosphohydrolase n=1 Tax=Deinococcus deserti (strain DSM 17065 / CIP 109153 / LMG 22923 / VCD115) TaxID=546414 RepID=C1CZU0_DEIDV|nr:HD domain-containing phosphohydrolase [Deinococcus deserti]ACO45192.1 putative diguanylate cyclase(GGDEF)/Metal dependent phosphohydrolase [Deinococcus deserti VCD115]
MKDASSPDHDRLLALARYVLSNSSSSHALENITQLAARFLGRQGAQLNLISEHQQHTRAHFNWEGSNMPRELCFCTHTISLPPGELLLEIPDTALDAHFKQHPLVVDEPHLRYYAGTPLYTPDGYAIGSLCVLDTRPQAPLTSEQQLILTQLAELAVIELERERATQALQASFQQQQAHEARLQAMMAHTTDLVIFRDSAGMILDLNPAAERVLGYRRGAPGQIDLELFGEEEYIRTRASEEHVMRTGEHLRHERRIHLSGRERVFEADTFPLQLSSGEVDGVIVVARDLTERHELQQALQAANTELESRVQERTNALENLAYRDPLTRLSNRRAFDLILDTALTQAEHTGTAVHLVIFDLDELKAMNDRFGHTRGDEFLKTFSSALGRVFHQGSVFRFGGDEFAVIFEGEPPDSLLDMAAQTVLLTRESGFLLVNASFGIASSPADAVSASDLLRLADQRMLRDKIAKRAARHMQAPQPTGYSTTTPHTPASVLEAIRATLHLLAQEGELDDVAWKGLLEAAVVSVPGAEAGSLTLFEERGFVYRAQVGFSDALLGMRHSVADAHAWYGAGDWQTGRARLIEGADAVREHSRVAVDSLEQREVYERYGALRQLKANVSVPVVLNGEVLAVINLDNLSHEAAFDQSALQTAEEFAALAAALLSDYRRRARELARQRELEVLVRVSATLRDARTPDDVETPLCMEAVKLLETEQVVYLRHLPDEETLQLTVRGWPSETTPRSVPCDDGPLWAALHSRRQQQVRADAASAELFHLPEATLLVTPLWAGEQALGVLVAAHRAQAPFTDLEAKLIAAVASSGVSALQRVRAEQGQAERVAELHLLADLARLKGALDPPAQVAQRCVAAARTFLGADYAGYLHLDPRTAVSDGSAPSSFHAAVAPLIEDSQELDQLLDPEAPRIVAGSYPQSPDAVPALVRAGVQGLVVIPVVDRGRRVGLVCFIWFQPRRTLPSAAETLATRVAELIGRVIERHAYIEDLKNTREGALLALGMSLELRDFETHGHTERVVTLSTRFACHLGLKDEEREGLRQGAYLHDVGKLAIPDSVLLKPGKLDAEEWRLMQTHAATGADMIQRIPTIHPIARSLIRHHHERWDGRGYPDGLAGEDIPLAARVFSLVDVYDALTSERPYKRPWTPAEAREEIRRQAGAQFDPALAKIFLELVESMEE